VSAVTIAIAGGSASGKSTLANRLCGALVSCAIACRVIGTDRYFRRDDPDAPRFLFSSSGEFEFNANDIDSAANERLVADIDVLRTEQGDLDVIIVEGLMTLAVDSVRGRCDLKLFVDLEPDVRLGRRLLRDLTTKRSFTEPEKIVAYYLECARIGHNRFVEPSKMYADIIVRGDADFDRTTSLLVPVILFLIAKEPADDPRKTEKILIDLA